MERADFLASAVPRATTCRAIAAWTIDTGAIAARTIDTRAIAARTVDTGAIAAWAIDAGAVAAWAIDTGAVAAWTVDTRAVAARSINSGLVNRSMPTVPSDRTAPAKASAPVIAAPIPAGAAPTVTVPTITPTLPDELNGLYDGQIIRRRTQARRGADHGGLSRTAAASGGESPGYDEPHDLLSHSIPPAAP